MELHRTDEGFALYKEKTQIGFCALTPAAKAVSYTHLTLPTNSRV